MYATCLFCHAPLGHNESIEAFPVGQRLAFDSARGRLWVVCRKCERWNLSPLEERWEAIEACERAFRETRLRVSTSNIGLARLRDGLELVRVGEALRPELAAWRYGDQFGRRRRRSLLVSGAAVAVVSGLVVAGPVAGIIAGGSGGLVNVASMLNNLYQERRVRARLSIDGLDADLIVRRRQLRMASVIAEGSDGFALRVPYDANDATRRALRRASETARAAYDRALTGDAITLRGEAAVRVAGQLLPSLNARGAGRRDVADAVSLVESAVTPEALFTRAGGVAGARHRTSPNAPLLVRLPTAMRLALEMAAHEESERRALEGELALLEAAWRDAERIAAIADDLLVPDDVRARVERKP